MRGKKLTVWLLFIGCGISGHAQNVKTDAALNTVKLVDPKATKKTRALYLNLQDIARRGVLFGHQDDLAYGVNWKNEDGRSDVKDVCGAYPAVFGWDVGKIVDDQNIDSINFQNMKKWIITAFKMGGINTISWHMDNPVSGGNSWDTTRAVAGILPDGTHHSTYRTKLDLFATFVKELKSGLFGTKVPIIFRPFHEHTGHWFWWGDDHCSKEEYVKLWRFTVHYLRDVKGLNNILYAYSTDVFTSSEEYLDYYPGDDYVDILAFDDYKGIKSAADTAGFIQRLKAVVQLAEEKNKVAALSETGLEAIGIQEWWTRILLESIKSDPVASRIAYVLVWRNANTKHHYAPYPGHSSSEDFIKFHNDPFTLFEDDLPRVYARPKK
ncbi:glycosyl hydrolase [Fulvivirgaceae bacterium BMA12]|uniref:Mannan endo-1,4-beta-mannosidase n=1 Tax=Agaribacillus aureus TaxID=3051825 RepID=A0ABT8L009_9BACT|nr:glycosyl hydrolase [Fulvivirgaceae bacterium BMA12]